MQGGNTVKFTKFNLRHPRWRIDHKYKFYLILQSDQTNRLTHVLLATSFPNKRTIIRMVIL